MEALISNVGCSLLASIIYDISKICLGKFYGKKDIVSIEKIAGLLRESLDSRYEILYMSGEFQNFLKSPFFKDTIQHYIIYKITGNCEGNLFKVKKSANSIAEKDIIEFLSGHLFQEYYEGTVTVPSRTLVRQFFEVFFKFSANYIVSISKDEDKMNAFFVNRRIDFAQESILLRLDETVEALTRTMKCEIIPVESKYEDYVKEYHDILRSNNSRAHVYLLDTFDFSEFYVPPFLRQLSPRQEMQDHIRWMRLDYLIHGSKEDSGRKEEYFDDWKYIFDCSSIVYVTGGAGYGKSLFLKKIINDFCSINILNSSDYLVIYGDLKSFYAEGDQPISVVKFLQNSMTKETLMDEKYLSIDMIEYYIKTGRCLILFDALDEVEKPKRDELHKRIITYFKNQNPNNKVCVTSRNRGFIPEKDVEAFDILPLDKVQIEAYVDNIIKLGRFDPKDKETFLEQSNILVKKKFLNSFLVLSLLINIYKAERELPENKMELYQKCFDYIAYRREKEKTKAKFDWDLISCMMKDNTFMELAKMCFPNNSDIGKNEIVEMLCRTYSGKYASLSETEHAAEDFLAFCSDRTELFVPAAGEDRFKFFHRSFFEYFYSQYIFLRIRDVDEVYKLLEQFDVDSEVFELTLAMMKQKDEPRYQELVEYIFSKADEDASGRGKRASLTAFNILTLGMQVVDDNVYMRRYVGYLSKNSPSIIRNIDNIPNQGIIYDIIAGNQEFTNQILTAYGSDAKLKIIMSFLEALPMVDSVIDHTNLEGLSEDERKHYISRRLFSGYGITFYLRLYIKNTDYYHLLSNLSEDDLESLLTARRASKRIREKYMKLYSRYQALHGEKRELIHGALSYNPFTRKGE